jgi:hypothetical protein
VLSLGSGFGLNAALLTKLIKCDGSTRFSFLPQ